MLLLGLKGESVKKYKVALRVESKVTAIIIMIIMINCLPDNEKIYEF